MGRGGVKLEAVLQDGLALFTIHFTRPSCCGCNLETEVWVVWGAGGQVR